MSHPPQHPPLDWPHDDIGFVDAVKRGFVKYGTFTGRASRGEYWWWILFVAISYVGLGWLSARSAGDGTKLGFYGALALLGYLATLLPTLSLTVRRLHDVGRSAWWSAVTLVPLVGGLILVTFLAGDTAPAAARYGPPHPARLPLPGSPPVGHRRP